jgi:fructosamine-3-kinase
MSADALRRALGGALGRDVVGLRAVGGGDLNDGYAARLDGGEAVFVKTRAGAEPAEFSTEAEGLRWLAAQAPSASRRCSR